MIGGEGLGGVSMRCSLIGLRIGEDGVDVGVGAVAGSGGGVVV